MGQNKDSSIGEGKKNAGITKEVLQPLLGAYRCPANLQAMATLEAKVPSFFFLYFVFYC